MTERVTLEQNDMPKADAVEFFAKFYRGKHHFPTEPKPYGGGWEIRHYGDLSTWDFNMLTRLVFLADILVLGGQCETQLEADDRTLTRIAAAIQAEREHYEARIAELERQLRAQREAYQTRLTGLESACATLERCWDENREAQSAYRTGLIAIADAFGVEIREVMAIAIIDGIRRLHVSRDAVRRALFRLLRPDAGHEYSPRDAAGDLGIDMRNDVVP